MLNLNDPDDARQYVLSWADKVPFPASKLFIDGTDEDFLLIAIQLFLFVDTRPPLGMVNH